MELIDRDVLRDKITQRIIEEDTEFPEYDWGTGLSIAKDILDRMPTVKAVPVRHGHWVGIDDEPYEVWECDRCGYTYESEHRYNYCPHCGADMRERETE